MQRFVATLLVSAILGTAPAHAGADYDKNNPITKIAIQTAQDMMKRYPKDAYGFIRAASATNTDNDCVGSGENFEFVLDCRHANTRLITSMDIQVVYNFGRPAFPDETGCTEEYAEHKYGSFSVKQSCVIDGMVANILTRMKTSFLNR